MTGESLEHFLQSIQQRIQTELLKRLPDQQADSQKLHEATRYAVLNGGKRLRPALVYAACQACGQDLAHADPAASAIEMIHCYSLVHDDLPAMDDDELRRGQATCHIAYDEGTAILVGDTLQTTAFQVLLNADYQAQQMLNLIRLLVNASGFKGMADGQALDLEAEEQVVSLQQLHRIHALKTGKLITCALQMGAECANASDQNTKALTEFGESLGLAFQIKDDILDVIANTEVLGKQQGSDQRKNKSTFPSLLGLEGAESYLADVLDKAKASLQRFSGDKQRLLQIADYIAKRQN